MTNLTKYDAACHALAECVRVDEAKDILDKAAQLAAVAKIAGDTELQANAERIIWRAKDRMGVLLKEMVKSGERDAGKGGNRRSQYPNGIVKLSDIGISPKLSAEAQKVAVMDAKVKEEALASEQPSKAMKKNLTKPRPAPRQQTTPRPVERKSVRQATAEARHAEIERLAKAGVAPYEIATRVGVVIRQVHVVLQRMRIREEAEAIIDPTTLSKSAQEKLATAIKQELKRLAQENETTREERSKKWLQEMILPDWRKKVAHADAIIKSRRGVFPHTVYRNILACLNSSTRVGVTDKRLDDAFRSFKAMEIVLLSEKELPVGPSSMPNTWEEWERAREAVRKANSERSKKAAAARKGGAVAKR